MKKKFLSLVLVLAMALTLLPTTAFAAGSTPHDADSHTNITWTSNGDGTHSGECQADDCNQDGVAQNESCAPAANAAWKAGTGDNAGKRVQECEKCQAEINAHTCAVGSNTNWAAGTGDNSGKRVQKCGTCGAEINAHECAVGSNTNWTTGTGDNAGKRVQACGTCGAEINAHTCAAGTGPDADTTKCGTCGATLAGSGGQATKITSFSASVSPAPATAGGTVSITITANPEAAAADLEVSDVVWTNQSGSQRDETGTKTQAPSTPGVYTVAITVALKESPAGNWTLPDTTTYAIKDLTVNAASSGTTTPTTPSTDTSKDEEKAPTTNSQGVPKANEVGTVKQANQAIATLKKTDADVMAERIMTNETASSSFASLDRAVQDVKGIKVSVDVDESSVPSIVRSGVDVVGAALNASGSKVALVVDVPSKTYTTSSGYQISMTMTGVSNPAKLAVPVIITLPMPADIRAERVVVLHYHGDSSQPDVIIPSVSGSYLRFPVTGFSDFVITDVGASVGTNGGTSGFYTTVQGGKNKNSSNNIEDILPAIAAMLSGNGVFVDVQGDHWAAKEIRWARDGGVMSGYEGGYFRPTGATTRQQLWMVLARLSGTRPADMAMAREWAINTGVSDGSNPTGALSRQQLVTMLYRYAKSQGVNVSASAKLGSFSDGAKVASYAKDAMSWAVGKGIMGGSNGKLNPESVATRAHFAVFLYRYSNG